MKTIAVKILRFFAAAVGGILLLVDFLAIAFIPSGAQTWLGGIAIKASVGILLLGCGVVCLALGTAAGHEMEWKQYLIMRLWQISGIVLLIYGADHLFFIVLSNAGNHDVSTRVIQGILAMLYWQAGIFCLKRGRKHRAVNALELAKTDPRAAVFYLRPFDDDKTAARSVGTPFMGMQRFKLGSLTEEEQLKEVLSEIGPFKALGRPREKLPELGAVRGYAGSEWEQKVQQEISQAGLVVLRAGATDNLIKEANIAVGQLNPGRLVVLIPVRRGQYEDFREKTRDLFPRGLPEFSEKAADGESGSLAGVVYFDRDWTPRLAPIVAPRWLSRGRLLSAGRPLIPSLITAFTPLFDRFSITPPRLHTNWGLTLLRFAWWLIAVLCLLFALWIVYMHFTS